MRISDWSSDVCSSDLLVALVQNPALKIAQALAKSFALICGAIWLFVHMLSPFVPASVGRTLERIIAAVVDSAVALVDVAVFRVAVFVLFDLCSNPFTLAVPRHRTRVRQAKTVGLRVDRRGV